MMKVLVVLACMLAVAAAECPNYWTKFDQSCYRVFGYTMKWQDAENECIKLSPAGRFAQLVSINNQYENQFLLSFWTETVGQCRDDFWTGGNDIRAEGQWGWSNYDAFEYTYWGSGEPNNDKDQDCLRMLSNGQWDDEQCGESRTFVCETAYT